MLPRLFINAPVYFSHEQIATIEEAKNARYIGSSSIPVKTPPSENDADRTQMNQFAQENASDFEWSYRPLDIFWQAVKHPDSGEHLFGLHRQDGKILIRGTNKWSGVVYGILIPATNVLTYSVYRHDFYCPNDSIPNAPRVCVDGGRDYMRTLGHFGDYKHVYINLVNRTFNHEGSDEQLPFDFPLSTHRRDGAEAQR